MTVTINDNDLSINWSYSQQELRGVMHKATTCTIKKGFGPNAEVLSKETAYCHEKDCFSKSEGRKKSLTKAMKAMNASYSEKVQVWNRYVSRVPLLPDGTPLRNPWR